MASLQPNLGKALASMADGSQEDVRVVGEALGHLRQAHISLAKHTFATQVAAAAPSLRDLLHAAGWLYPCFMPSSRLESNMQEGAWRGWCVCMRLVTDNLLMCSVTNMAAYQHLVEPRSQPRVPGLLSWMGSMADELTPGVLQQMASAGRTGSATAIVSLWSALTIGLDNRGFFPQLGLQVLQPGVIRLVHRLTQMPPDALAAADPKYPHTLEYTTASTISNLYGAQLALSQRLGGASDSSAGSHHQSTPRDWSQQQVDALQPYQGIWWRGMASYASTIRAGHSNRSSSGSSNTGGAAHATSSSSSYNAAAALCPKYHAEWEWPDSTPLLDADTSRSFGAVCLELLLLREAMGVLPWAQQQLAPYSTVVQAGGNTTLLGDAGLWIQWPMVGCAASSNRTSASGSNRGGGTSASSSGSSRTTSAGTSASSSSSTRTTSTSSDTCRCHAHTCHLCTPPPPVTLQQLHLALEVVCLTCQETTLQAQQAPVLLALLMQRASPGVRASFLNSADGTRLLVALQQMASAKEAVPSDCTTAWSFAYRQGAPSISTAVGGPTPMYQVPVAASRALYALAWCFLDTDAGTTAAAVATAAAASGAGGTTKGAAARRTAKLPAAVAHGSVLGCPALHFKSYLHMLQVPATSLRLAAGVQPSLALFATLEAWLRQPRLDNLVLVLTTLLAAIQGLLEQGALGPPGGCEPQADGAAASNAALGTTTSTQTSSRSSSHASVNSHTSATIASDDTSSNEPSHNSSSSMGGILLPEVLGAVSSVAITVSKMLMHVGSAFLPPLPQPRHMCIQKEVAVLGACLCNAVLQLALQQCRRDLQQTPLLQAGISKGARHGQLVEAAQRLLRWAAFAVAAEVQQTRGSGGWISPEERLNTTRLLSMLLHTSLVRLSDLQKQASGVAATAHSRQMSRVLQAATAAGEQASAGGAGQYIGTISHPAAAGEGGPGYCKDCNGTQPWCPAHSSSLAPVAVEEAAEVSEAHLIIRISAASSFIAACVRPPLLAGCSYSNCNNLAGPSEAGLVASCRGGRCQGCGVARYCSSFHAQLAWPAHRKVCGRLAAALGRRAATTTTTSSSSSSNISQVRGPRTGTAQARGFLGPRPSAATQGAASGASSSSSDTAPGRDQVTPPSSRVCAWCGAAAPNLLRCGRCKAAWYLGADHQRAAWKAGHKEECRAAAAASLSG